MLVQMVAALMMSRCEDPSSSSIQVTRAAASAVLQQLVMQCTLLKKPLLQQHLGQLSSASYMARLECLASSSLQDIAGAAWSSSMQHIG